MLQLSMFSEQGMKASPKVRKRFVETVLFFLKLTAHSEHQGFIPQTGQKAMKKVMYDVSTKPPSVKATNLKQWSDAIHRQ